MEIRNKKDAVEELLSKGDTMLCIDSRHPEIKVPAAQRGTADLRLVLNLGFRHSIQVLPEGIEAELLFGGSPSLCWIPYDSLWSVFNPQTGEGYLWPGQLPEELHDLFHKELKDEEEKGGHPIPSLAAESDPPVKEPKKRQSGDRSHLRVIPGGKKDK